MFGENSKWIWIDHENNKDTYAEFYSEVMYSGGESNICISVDSNYCLYINGKFVASGQYADYPHYKVYDEIDITKYMEKGVNKIAIIVWYYGVNTFSYYVGNAALKYEISIGNKVVDYSDENTLSRKSHTYASGNERYINRLLGLSFSYDATKYDGWKTKLQSDFSKSVIINQELPLYKNQIKKLSLGENAPVKQIKQSENYYLYDLGREEVGYITLKIISSKKQKITIAYGEHIKDGNVRRIIGKRDFSVEIIVGEGVTEYTNYFRRLGLRYFEIHSEDEISVEYASVIPCLYPVNIKYKNFNNKLHQKIYDVSVRTLQLCMHEHYEDCPWREQAMYAMDSRNQMLCGYYAFEEYVFPRECLRLMSKNFGKDGLLSICTPTSVNMTIPSFSLFYIIAAFEYMKYSNDSEFIKEIYDRLEKIMNVFLAQMQDGLVLSFENKEHWNFYEWSDDLDGHGESSGGYECVLNCLVSLALDRLHKIGQAINKKTSYSDIRNELNKKIKDKFYNKKTRLFVNRLGEETYSELANSLAIVTGVVNARDAEYIAGILTSENSLTEISLSMICFKYDALLMAGDYKEFIICDIEKKYSRMLSEDATSFWETEKGERDFNNAGSLCHGWSAIPCYYLSELLQ